MFSNKCNTTEKAVTQEHLWALVMIFHVQFGYSAVYSRHGMASSAHGPSSGGLIPALLALLTLTWS